jgi:predicted component of type VI protein secretion system
LPVPWYTIQTIGDQLPIPLKGLVMLAQLVALNDGPSILVDKPILLVGRHPECDIQIESRKISRRHCCIAQVNGYLVVRDLASTNGIRINGVRVVEGKLKEGDELTIGSSRFQVRLDVVAPPARPPRPAPAPPRGKPARAPMADDLLEGFDDPVPLEEEPDESLPLPTAKPKPPSVIQRPPNNPPPGQPRPGPAGLPPAGDILRPPSSPSHPA